MFKKIICDKCHKAYDEALETCPECGEINRQSKNALGTRNITFLPYAKQIGLFLIGWLGFQLIGYIVSMIMSLTGQLVYNYSGQALEDFMETAKVSMIINFVSYTIIFGLLVLFLFKDTKKLLVTFKGWKPFVAGAICFVSLIGFSIFYNTILQILGVTIKTSGNEEKIREIVTQAPILSLLIFGIIGPVCEELTYRIGLYSFLRRINKYLAIIVSVLVFALIHFDYHADDIANEFLNLPVYLFGAFTLTFTYCKFGFAASTVAHISNNIFSLLMTLISSKL